jgi:hypothetical protein
LKFTWLAEVVVAAVNDDMERMREKIIHFANCFGKDREPKIGNEWSGSLKYVKF